MMVPTIPQNNQVEIAKAEPANTPELMRICQQSFPGSLRWFLPSSVGKRWWRRVLRAQCCETWVVKIEGEICGLSLLIVDEAAWRKRLQRSNRATVTRAATKLLKLTRGGTRNEPTQIDAYGSHTIRNSSDRGIGPVRTWIELIAIAPESRGNGLARLLLRHIEARSSELGYSSVQLRVDATNKSAREFYVHMGYEVRREAFDGAILGKSLAIDVDDTTEETPARIRKTA